MAVIVHRGFFQELPELDVTNPEQADIAWMIYDLKRDSKMNIFRLHLSEIRYTNFESALDRIVTSDTGDINAFTKNLETRIKSGKLFGIPPSSPVEPTIEPVDYEK